MALKEGRVRICAGETRAHQTDVLLLLLSAPSPSPTNTTKPQAKTAAKDYDEADLAFLAKKKEVRWWQHQGAVGGGGSARRLERRETSSALTRKKKKRKKKQEERALKALREKAAKGPVGGTGLKKSGKK